METKTVKYINVNGKLMDLSHPQVMGILNVTPDSFYAGSRNYVAEGSITSREYMDKLEHFIRVKVGGVLQVNYQAALRSRYDSIAGNYRKGGK